jgi:hypothetical protein
MKKLSVLLAAIIFMLLSVPASAQRDCEPLKTRVIIHYDNSQEPLPKKLCITVVWGFGPYGKCEQTDELPITINTGVFGTLDPVFFILDTEEECPGECMEEEDVVSITVYVSNCKGIEYSSIPSNNYQSTIDVDYF